jgi:hypothetical protein
MADAQDLKSWEGNFVRVRVPPGLQVMGSGFLSLPIFILVVMFYLLYEVISC